MSVLLRVFLLPLLWVFLVLGYTFVRRILLLRGPMSYWVVVRMGEILLLMRFSMVLWYRFLP